LDGRQAVIGKAGGPVRVELADVTHARLVEPSTREILALEAVAAKGWQARDTKSDFGWLLRANDGFSLRANSVLALREPSIGLAEALAGARAWYADRGLPLVITVPLPARRALDEALKRLGWTTRNDVDVMVATTSAVIAAASTAAAAPVQLTNEPDGRWLEEFHHHSAPSAEVARGLLTRHRQACFARIELDGQIVAIGRGVVDEGWLGVSAIAVAERVRRHGLAQALVAELSTWGADLGAQRVYLQVEQANSAGIELYHRLAFWRHHHYRYWVDPSPAG
jgi:GNAT superfamily N-acetyltransferase